MRIALAAILAVVAMGEIGFGAALLILPPHADTIDIMGAVWTGLGVVALAVLVSRA